VVLAALASAIALTRPEFLLTVSFTMISIAVIVFDYEAKLQQYLIPVK